MHARAAVLPRPGSGSPRRPTCSARSWTTTASPTRSRPRRGRSGRAAGSASSRWDGQTLIAQNDSANAYAPGLWTRIDWVRLDGMAPYTWAFCLTAYDAPTRAAAEATPPADRATPRTGCNGYPFSRMRRP